MINPILDFAKTETPSMKYFVFFQQLITNQKIHEYEFQQSQTPTQLGQEP